jgi:hypothetical protein
LYIRHILFSWDKKITWFTPRVESAKGSLYQMRSEVRQGELAEPVFYADPQDYGDRLRNFLQSATKAQE